MVGGCGNGEDVSSSLFLQKQYTLNMHPFKVVLQGLQLVVSGFRIEEMVGNLYPHLFSILYHTLNHELDLKQFCVGFSEEEIHFSKVKNRSSALDICGASCIFIHHRGALDICTLPLS